jgi:hypothetical protein
MTNNAIFNPMAFDLDALPVTRGGGRVEKVEPKKFSSAAAPPF